MNHIGDATKKVQMYDFYTKGKECKMRKKPVKEEQKEYRGGLCFRCEYRAQFHETKSQPRCECGMSIAVHACYMFKPVVPLVLVPLDRKDKRPFLGPAFIASRATATGLAEGKWHAVRQGKGIAVYFKPKADRKMNGA